MEKYKLQLEQVNHSLANNLNNKQLLILKSKLEKLLDLKSESESKNLSITRDKVETNDFPLQIGEVCEIFDESLKFWRAGIINSMTLDREFFIVTLRKNKETFRVPAVHVRRIFHPEKKPKQNTNSIQNAMISKPKKVQSEPEGSHQWKIFADKMIRK